jgi:hypothetical protein
MVRTKIISFRITLDRLKRIDELKKLLRIQNRSQLLNWAIDCYSDAKIEKKLPDQSKCINGGAK